MSREIKKVAVLGAGVMGAGIAAHVVGAGIPCLLLDIVPKDLPPGGDRNAFAKKGLETVLSSKPSLIFSKADAKKIEVGNLEDDFDRLKECDWIVEVVIERLDIKKSLFERIDKVMRPGTIVSSNTSGLPLASMSNNIIDQEFIIMKLPTGHSSVSEEVTKASKKFPDLPFVNVQKYLSGLELPTAKIVIDASREGILVLEDLGDLSLEKVRIKVEEALKD